MHNTMYTVVTLVIMKVMERANQQGRSRQFYLRSRVLLICGVADALLAVSRALYHQSRSLSEWTEWSVRPTNLTEIELAKISQ